MKKQLQRMLAGAICLGLSLMPACASSAEGAEDSEAVLREQVGYMEPGRTIGNFYYGDYDGDGIHEAFAILDPREDDGEIITGDICFVSPLLCKVLQSGKSYYQFEMCGEEAPILFTAEEGYGGSGSTSYLWTVVGSMPVEVDPGRLEGFSYGGNGEFYTYPSAFDLCTDGTGHSWKRYYYFMDGGEMREYGGIYITRSELEEFEGARQILEGAEGEGYVIGTIIYRGNGVINVNMCRDNLDNENLTLRYDATSVVDTGERFGGVYELASNPASAVYPQAFVHPSGQASTSGATSQAAGDFAAQTGGAEGERYSIDLGDDGSVETIALYRARTNEDGYDAICYMMDIYAQDGQRVAQQLLTSWSVDCPEEFFDVQIRVAQISPSEIYAESMFHLDGTGITYMLYGWDGASLVLEKGVIDPGYSDGEGLYDAVSDEVLYQSESGGSITGKYGDGLSALNGEFNAYGLTFSGQDVTFYHEGVACCGSYNIAEILQGQVIWSFRKGELEADASAAMTSTSDYDAAQSFAEFMNRADAAATSAPAMAAQASGQAQGRSYVRATHDVNIRTEANKDSGIIAVLLLGEQLEYADETRADLRGVDWYKVFYNGGCGWVSSVYSQIVGAAAPDQSSTSGAGSQTVRIVGGNANVRSGPGLDYTAVGSLNEGRVATYLGELSTDARGVAWYHIEWNGVEGWVSSKYARLES